MKSVDDLQDMDYIAFGFHYHGGEPNYIIVDNITKVYSDKVLVHFLYGHKSLSQYVMKEDVLAIGNSEGEGTIEGWAGKYDILQPEKIREIQERERENPNP